MGIYRFKTLILVLMMLAPGLSNTMTAQNQSGTEKNEFSRIPDSYDRSSLSWIIIYDRTDPYINDLKAAYDKISHNNKFFVNDIETRFIELKTVRTGNTKVLPEKTVSNSLDELDVSQKIISFWYNRNEEGFMDMELIHQRGLQNATDADVLVKQTTTRGNMALMDYGNRLISKSYVVVLDFYSVKRVNDDDKEGYAAQYNAYLYKMNLPEGTKEMIYDSWATESDTEEEKWRKRNKFNDIEAPLELVTKISATNSEYNYDEDTFLGQLQETRTREQLFGDMMNSVYEDIIFKLEKEHTDFKVVTSLYAVKPPSAKIGRKEGLKTDQRFFVYEHRYNPKNGKIKEVRRGVIRAGADIVDNTGIASGETQPSKFYQVSGRRLEEGYTIQQRNDWGFGITVGQNTGGEMAGFNIGGDYSVGRFIEVPSFYLTANIAFENNISGYGVRIITSDIDYNGIEELSFFRFDVGIMKGYHFMRNFELNPYLAYGQESASIPGDDDKSIYTNLIKTGAYLSLNITYFWEFIGGINFNMPFANAYEKIGEEDAVELDKKYNDFFPGRKGMSFYYGIRIRF